jgi:hypothetical protein
MQSVHEILTNADAMEQSALAALVRDVLSPRKGPAKIIILDDAAREWARARRAAKRVHAYSPEGNVA